VRANSIFVVAACISCKIVGEARNGRGAILVVVRALRG